MTSSTPQRPCRLLVAALAASVCSVFLATTAPLTAAPTELLISEYIEGSSNNKALEIYNGTGAPVDLAAGGYSIQMFFNGSATSGLTINLIGTVAPGDVFVLAHGSASATILAQADQTNSSGWFNGDDAVVLRKGTAVIDAVGQVGFDPGTEWGTGLVSSADNTLRRKASMCVGDLDTSNAFDPSAAWDGFATDTVDGLGSHTVNCEAPPPGDAAPTVTSTVPSNGALDFPVAANLSVTFSEPVSATAGAFTLVCATSGSVAVTPSGGPTTFTLDPAADLVNGEACTLTVVAAQVSDQDGNDPPDNMTADFTVGFTPFDVCAQPFTPISSIQGSGASAAITGAVTTRGVVVADLEGTSSTTSFRGLYIQDPVGDGNPLTSDGLFVFTSGGNLASAGDVVRVTGTASEFNGQTQVSAASVVKCGSGSVTPTEVQLPFLSSSDPERYEGMLVRFPQSLVISEYFNFDRFGELVLALPRDGEPRLFTPTAVVSPGASANALAAENLLRQILVDDGLNTSNPPSVRHPNGSPFGLGNRFRGGDTVANLEGVMGFGFSRYRIQPTAPAQYTPVNERTTAPQDVGGSIRVAAMNTLNFFLTQDYPTGDPLDNRCGPLQDEECRGADADQPTEFGRQRTKLLAALAALDADVVGLNELENTPGVEPLGDPTAGIVAGLNEILGAGTYAFIDTGVIGSDAIRVGMIYRPTRVTPVGPFKTLDATVDPRFLDTRNRPSLAQAFETNANGARFSVVVNHLKSKGSACESDTGPVDPDAGDGQGNCNGTRTNAARALADWLATDPTGSGDADVLIVGDLNAYAKEDPITALRAGADDTAGTADDYTNLVERYVGARAYSYVFDAQVGYLDHAIGSPSLAAQSTGATEWHINADEPDILDYDTTFKPVQQDALYEPNAYRSSDHDPVVVGLEPIRYAFSGFTRLAYDIPAFNTVNAGSSLAVKFSLGGYRGLEIFQAGYPQSVAISCDAGAGVSSAAEETGAPGASTLSYDPAADLYNYVWKTQKAWSGTCRRFVVVLGDGSVHYANIWFR